MENKCLVDVHGENAFLEHYKHNPIFKKALESAGIGLGVGGVVVGGSAFAAATTGFAGFTSSLGIGYFAASAAATAATAALSFAIPAALVIGGVFYIKNRKSKKKIDRGDCHVYELANEVGKIIFLPMIAKANEIIKEHPDYKNDVRKLIEKYFGEWGYKQQYADEVLDKWLGSEDDVNIVFNGYLDKIESLKNDTDSYKEYNDKDTGEDIVIMKSEVPPKALRQLAVELANKIKK